MATETQAFEVACQHPTVTEWQISKEFTLSKPEKSDSIQNFLFKEYRVPDICMIHSVNKEASC